MNVNATVLKQRQNSDQEESHNATREEAKDPRGRKGRDGYVILLGRSHQGRPEAGDTLTMISHGVEISIARGGADEKDETINLRCSALHNSVFHSSSQTGAFVIPLTFPNLKIDHSSHL